MSEQVNEKKKTKSREDSDCVTIGDKKYYWRHDVGVWRDRDGNSPDPDLLKKIENAIGRPEYPSCCHTYPCCSCGHEFVSNFANNSGNCFNIDGSHICIKCAKIVSKKLADRGDCEELILEGYQKEQVESGWCHIGEIAIRHKGA